MWQVPTPSGLTRLLISFPFAGDSRDPKKTIGLKPLVPKPTVLRNRTRAVDPGLGPDTMRCMKWPPGGRLCSFSWKKLTQVTQVRMFLSLWTQDEFSSPKLSGSNSNGLTRPTKASAGSDALGSAQKTTKKKSGFDPQVKPYSFRPMSNKVSHSFEGFQS